MSNLGESIRLNIILPLAERIIGASSCKWLKQIEYMQSWSREEVIAWQNERLQALVKHAYEHTIYYKELFDKFGLKPSDIQCAEDLKKLPIITKEIAVANYDKIVPDNIQSFPHRKRKTGGTSGEPMHYLMDENNWGYTSAAKLHAWMTTSYQYGDKFVAMGSASLFAKKPSLPRRIYDKIRREYPLNTVNLTDELCEKYIDFLKKNHIKYIYGYAGSIYVFTSYVAKHNVDLTQIEAVYTTSENLTDDYRALIEKTYQCQVMDCYGANDAGMNAYEINRGHYHVGYNVVCEIINPIAENTGTVLTTNLLNYTFPLLRYQFGDEAELCPEGEYKGYNGQSLRRVLGRTSDIMRLENGHNMTATGFSMIMKEFDVVAFSFNKSGVNHVTLTVQPIREKYTEQQEQEIRKTIYRYIGTDAKLDIVYVDHFEPLKNGKRRYFMNDLSNND
jgi:phenylacetate-CoA ligase